MIMSKKKNLNMLLWRNSCGVNQINVRAVNQFSFTPGIFSHMNKPQIKTVTKRVSSKEV